MSNVIAFPPSFARAPLMAVGNVAPDALARTGALVADLAAIEPHAGDVIDFSAYRAKRIVEALKEDLLSARRGPSACGSALVALAEMPSEAVMPARAGQSERDVGSVSAEVIDLGAYRARPTSG